KLSGVDGIGPVTAGSATANGWTSSAAATAGAITQSAAVVASAPRLIAGGHGKRWLDGMTPPSVVGRSAAIRAGRSENLAGRPAGYQRTSEVLNAPIAPPGASAICGALCSGRVIRLFACAPRPHPGAPRAAAG